LYKIINTNPGESLGQKVGQFASLQAAMSAMEKEASLP